MATKTTNYELIKPAQTDYYTVDDFNGNADIVDRILKHLQDTKAGLGDDDRILPDLLPHLNTVASSYDSARSAIKLSIDKPYTGQLVTFSAPCESITVTGGFLIGNDLYSICDAMGNSLLKLYRAWGSGVQLAAILDVEKKVGYLINHNQLRKFEVLVTVPASSWSRDTSDGRAYATVNVANIDEDCFIFVNCRPSGDINARNEQQKAWMLICEIDDSTAGQLKMTCYGDIPTVDLTLKVGVIP